MKLIGLVLLFLAFCCSHTAFGQEDETGKKVLETQYPMRARQARISGNVWLSIDLSDNVEVESGHHLLVPVAMKSLKSIGRTGSVLGLLSDEKIKVVYHFVLTKPDIRTTKTVVQKGDAFDRLILRVLRLKTTKVVENSECFTGPKTPKNRMDNSVSPVEIWIYGVDVAECIETEAGYIASR